MPVIVTTMHNAAALRTTCHRLGLDQPTQDSVWLGNRELFGWMVHLPGLYAPLVCDTLTGLVAYHHRDNEFRLYAHIMRFVHRYYDVQARLRRSNELPVTRTFAHRKRRRLAPAGLVA
jgi:hypothetical protein